MHFAWFNSKWSLSVFLQILSSFSVIASLFPFLFLLSHLLYKWWPLTLPPSTEMINFRNKVQSFFCFCFFFNSLKFHKSRQTNISKLTYIFTWLPRRALRSSLPWWTLTNTDCKHSATAHHSDSKIFSNEQLTKNKKIK